MRGVHHRVTSKPPENYGSSLTFVHPCQSLYHNLRDGAKVRISNSVLQARMLREHLALSRRDFQRQQHILAFLWNFALRTTLCDSFHSTAIREEISLCFPAQQLYLKDECGIWWHKRWRPQVFIGKPRGDCELSYFTLLHCLHTHLQTQNNFARPLINDEGERLVCVPRGTNGSPVQELALVMNRNLVTAPGALLGAWRSFVEDPLLKAPGQPKATVLIL
mmetsp:Transcript_98728/g.175747  ORF Transcript_98728/g.175747 Transcript_98728/m.175747 type:complete len:220 (-) Transcript_98728:104-763(-)